MERACEPWDNSYVRDGDTECLLRRLDAEGPLTQDAIVRSCLRNDEIRPLLDPVHAERQQNEMLWGLARLVFSFGKSTAFSDAVRSSAQEIDTQRRSLDWSLIPTPLRGLAERRAAFILAFAQDERLIERDEASASWHITAGGRALLAKGGFSMK